MNRSRNEALLCQWLRQSYPLLTILNNDKTLIPGYEIDIVIPELRLGIEWNGAVHSRPIFGEQKLNEVLARDTKKVELANTLNVHLIVIRDPGAFSPMFVKKQLDKLWIIIDSLLVGPTTHD
jgi:hypothetical protein